MPHMAALINALVADPYISSHLARWDFGDGTERPAIFTMDPAPRECSNPVMVIQLDGGPPAGFRGYTGARMEFNVRIWGDQQASLKGLRILATNVFTFLHRKKLTVADYIFNTIEATFPTEINDQEGFPGFEINITLLSLKGVN